MIERDVRCSTTLQGAKSVRWLVAAAIFVWMVLAPSLVSADCAGPLIDVSNAPVRAGSRISVTGKYFAACDDEGGFGCSFGRGLKIEEAVLLVEPLAKSHLPAVPTASPTAGMVLGSVEVTDGAFQTTLAIPSLRPGRYLLSVRTAPDQFVASVEIRVLPGGG